MTHLTRVLTPPRAPVFLATMSGGQVTFSGDLGCSLGHKLARTEGAQGVFAEWSWNGQRLTAVNDRYGFHPLFVYHKGNHIGVSPSIATLVLHGADTELDCPALAVALRLGQFIGEDTPFRHIRALPPNATLQWDGRELRVSGGFEFRPAIPAPNRKEAVQTYVELFRRSIERRLPSAQNFAVPLSGGRDSRHILFELMRNGLRPAFCLTVMQYPDDVRVAGLLCKNLGLQHVVVGQPNAPFTAEIKKNWLTNFGVDEGVWQLAISDSLIERGITTIYDGIGGDLLSAGLFLERPLDSLFRTEQPRKVAEQLLSPDEEALLERVLARAFLSECSREAALERLAIEIARHKAAHNPVTSFYFWNRTRRKIALVPYGMLSMIPKVFSPYLDHDLFDFLASLPAEFLMDHSFHTETIVKGFPQWAHIPFEDKKAKDYDFSSMHARFARDYARFGLFSRPPTLLRTGSLYSRLVLSLTRQSFGASQYWYLRRAAWVQQLEEVIRAGKNTGQFAGASAHRAAA